MNSVLLLCFAAFATMSIVSSQMMGNYISEEIDRHVKGGIKIFSGVTEEQCLIACASLAECLSVDYNRKHLDCFGHTQETHCGAVEERHYVTHRKKIPCVRDESSEHYGSSSEEDEGTCMAAAVYENAHSPGGKQMCADCALEECLATCEDDVRCQAVDYNVDTSVCHHHDTRGACLYMAPLNGTRHIVKFRCRNMNSLVLNAAGLLRPNAVAHFRRLPPISADNSLDFTGLVYAGPTVSEIPSGWLLYPRKYILGGALHDFGFPLTKENAADMCVQVCEQESDCESVDFNTADGTCFKHTAASNTNCGFFGNADHIYHVKKERCYYHEMYGTGVITPIKFPGPDGVAP